MTPQLYPVIEAKGEFGLGPHLTVEVNGSRTCVPVGIELKEGDSLCVVPKGFSVALFAIDMAPNRNGHGLELWQSGRVSRIRNVRPLMQWPKR